MPWDRERPSCAGWHAIDPVCDGTDAGEPACLYRERCLVLVDLMGGRLARTNARALRVLAENEEEDIDFILAGRPASADSATTPPVPARAAPAPTPAPNPATVGVVGREGAALAALRSRQHRRPGPPMEIRPGSLAVLEVLMTAFAQALRRRYIGDGDPRMALSDVYLRFSKAGGIATAYEHTPGKARTVLARMDLHKRRPELTLRPNSQHFQECRATSPPTGLELTSWEDDRSRVVLKSVDMQHATATGRWLARLYKEELLR